MRLMKRLLFGNVGFALILLLAACGGGESGTTPEDGNDTDTNAEEGQEVVTITFARGVDATDGNEKMIEEFEEQHPHIKVNYMEMPADTGQSHDQYVTMFSAQSSEVDVFDSDVIWPAEFAQAGFALDLDRFIERDEIDMDAYFPGAVQAGNVNGRQYAMPKYIDAGLLYYRSDIVEETPKTWDELIEMAAQYQGEQGTDFGYVMQGNQYEGLVCNAIEFIEGYGGSVLDADGNITINSPETVKAIAKMVEIGSSDFVPANTTSFTEPETQTAFIEGQTVFARNWPYMLRNANDEELSSVAGNVGVTFLPAGDGGSAATLGGWMTMINRYTEHPEEAWEFVKFMNGYDGQKLTAIYGGRAPTLISLFEDEKVQEVSELFANEDFVQTLLNAVPRPITPIYPVLSDTMQIELSKALTGNITPEEAAENMQTKMEEVVSE